MSLQIALTVVLTVALLVWGLIRVLQYFFATVYFSVLDILRGFDLPATAVLVRAVIPIIAGGAIALVTSEDAYTIAAAGCALGALLSVWGALSSNFYIPWELQNRITSVRLVLIVFIVSYAFLGQLGVLAVEIARSSLTSSWFVQGIVSNLATTLLAVVFSQVFLRQNIRRLNEEIQTVYAERQDDLSRAGDRDTSGEVTQ